MNTTKPRKCNRRYNGIPGANTKRKRPEFTPPTPKHPLNASGTNAQPPEGLTSRILSCKSRQLRHNVRLARKLGILKTPSSGVSKPRDSSD